MNQTAAAAGDRFVGPITISVNAEPYAAFMRQLLPALLESLDAFEGVEGDAQSLLIRELCSRVGSKLQKRGNGAAGSAGEFCFVPEFTDVAEICAATLRAAESNGVLVRRWPAGV